MSYYTDRRRGYSNSGPRFDVKKPVEVDKEYEANIEDTSRRGDGIAKIEGFIIFVANAKQGEKVKFKVTKVGDRFATGELIPA
jgi:predicted RNA-binding protein with TRAM domain